MPWLDAVENVMVPLLLQGLDETAARRRAEAATLAGMASVADEVNRLGRFDAVIHNAGIGYREPRRVETQPGVPSVFAVNVLAPYALTPQTAARRPAPPSTQSRKTGRSPR